MGFDPFRDGILQDRGIIQDDHIIWTHRQLIDQLHDLGIQFGQLVAGRVLRSHAGLYVPVGEAGCAAKEVCDFSKSMTRWRSIGAPVPRVRVDFPQPYLPVMTTISGDDPEGPEVAECLGLSGGYGDGSRCSRHNGNLLEHTIRLENRQ